MIVHVVNNTLSVSLGRLAASDQPWVKHFVDTSGETPQYHAVWVLVAAGIAVTCLLYFSVVQPRHSWEADDAACPLPESPTPSAATPQIATA